MAWQLHYTSAAAGPSGRAGFQVVAESPGLPAGPGARVTPYLTYRPPPSAPAAPSPEEIRAMPVAMSYGPADDHYALVRCHYLGRDYSGRYGNFFGHALVLAGDDLVGVRPIEFWRAPLWADTPVTPGASLSELAELMPGTALDPDSLGQWLAAGGPGAYRRLSGLLELVRRGLVEGYGRLILVGADCEEIVRWIAVISYSLAWEAVTRLSFVTYSGDPAATTQLIVGTTPDVWIPRDVDATVVALADEPAAIETGRFSETVRELWQAMDLDGIDELAAFGPDDPDTAAALVALCRTGADLPAAEQAAVARLLGDGPPEWVWPPLGERADRLGYPLAAAVALHGPATAAGPCAARCVLLALRDPALAALDLGPHEPSAVSRKVAVPEAYREEVAGAAREALGVADRLERLVGVLRVADAAGIGLPGREVERAVAALVDARLTDVPGQLERTPYRWREALLAGLVTGLERATSAVRESALTPEVCRALAGRDLRATPGTAAAVIVWEVKSARLDRVEATMRLLALDHAPGTAREREAALGDIWREEPTATELRRLIEEAGRQVQDYYVLNSLPARLFVRTGLRGEDVVEVADRIRKAGLQGSVIDDAEAVLAATGLAHAGSLNQAVAEVERLTGLNPRIDPELVTLTRDRAARTLAEQEPKSRTALMRKLSRQSRDWLLEQWLTARPNRAEQAALLEIAIRLREEGVHVPRLEEWAYSLVRGRLPFGSVDSRFRKDRELAEGLRRLMKPKRRVFGGD
ncbi:hypothetical protein SAMN05444920_115123 [Nonomuraea solani]|uniref:Uncharacterized protein n=1 Tax=Nonomuraea solani TaxID=1144553 RepID=A0A1H6ETX3_9ACTN|nr:hypothetical protein [Nonomuraea solani]SEH00144.1 hypothetical protein SAMN05444920_115123 [Nonomuraea solani]